MTRRSKAIPIFDFTGGLNTKSSVTSLELNQSRDIQNINILPNGGFEKRQGNVAFNASAMASSAAVHGLGYYRQSDGDDFLMAIAGTGVFKSDSLDGTMDTITGAVTVTTGQDNIWTHSVLNNLSIFVGGAPDAPIKWNGSGNADVLGGSPPSGAFGLTANNRLFIGDTTANPSRIAWSILGNPEDWTGTGSGTQDVQANDGDVLVGAAVHSIDHMLLFKQNSIHDLAIRTAPFPLFPLFREVGAISKRGILNVDGIVYFITPEPRMKATDGSQIIDFPDTIDNVWDSLNPARLKYLHGLYYRRLHQIWWFVSTTSATSHDLVIIWDLKRKCWLRHTTGYKMNVSCIAQDRTAYCGAYDGKLYRQDVTNVYSDASETNTEIDSILRSGWMGLNDETLLKVAIHAMVNFQLQTSGQFELSYGYNFNTDTTIESISQATTASTYDTAVYDNAFFGGNSDAVRLIHMSGSGNFFQYAFRHNTAGEAWAINGLTLAMQEGGPNSP